MVADAERNREEDRRLRELTDARNELDSAAYQVERRLTELGEGAAAHERARAEMLVADARKAISEEAPLDRLRSLASELQQVYHSLRPAAGGAAGQGDTSETGEGSGGQDGDDDVIDAEFTTR